jgi:hypothetical protein
MSQVSNNDCIVFGTDLDEMVVGVAMLLRRDGYTGVAHRPVAA